MTSKHDIVKTPLPFPTLPIYAAPKSDRSWIQNNWWVIFVIETIVIFVAFCALLVYYLCFVRTPGKWITEDTTGNDGLSHYGSMVADSDISPSERSRSHRSSSQRSFEGNEVEGEPRENSAARRRGRRGESTSRRRLVLKMK